MFHFSYGGKNIGKVLKWEDINVEFGEDAEHIPLLVDLLLTIPAHSAECERGFSLLKTIKTDWRNKLSDEAVTNLIRITLESADIDSFNPDPAIHVWNTGSIRGRRPSQKRWRRQKQQQAVAGPDDDVEASSNESDHSDYDAESATDTESIPDNDCRMSEGDREAAFLALFESESDESDFHGFEL